MAAQIALAGQALWSASVAARAGARAALVGDDAAATARREWPSSMREEIYLQPASAGLSLFQSDLDSTKFWKI